MRNRRTIWFVAGVIILAIVGVGSVLALRIFGGDAPAEVALTSDQDTAGSGGSAQGSWTVDTASGSLGDATSTFAGYRIQEELGVVGAHTAVGRTRDVTGEDDGELLWPSWEWMDYDPSDWAVDRTSRERLQRLDELARGIDPRGGLGLALLVERSPWN